MRGCDHLLYHCLVGLQRELSLEGQGQLIEELCGSLASVSLPLGGGGEGRGGGRNRGTQGGREEGRLGETCNGRRKDRLEVEKNEFMMDG